MPAAPPRKHAARVQPEAWDDPNKAIPAATAKPMLATEIAFGVAPAFARRRAVAAAHWVFLALIGRRPAGRSSFGIGEMLDVRERFGNSESSDRHAVNGPA